MAPLALHLQALVGGEWQRAAVLDFPEPDRGRAGMCTFEYAHEYLVRWISDPPPLAAVSLTLPVAFGPTVSRRGWPAFLDDLRPMGSAHRWWLRRLNLPDTPASEFNTLARGTIAPIGNLRIEEALPERREAPQRFPRKAVIERESGFLEYAANAGAQVGGATGAGGDSPKLLLRRDRSDKVWIDAWQDDDSEDRHYLVKFARGRDERDRLILRSEHVYYRALAELGVDTISQDGLALEEGPAGPSLWLPRFDVSWKRGKARRHGLESLYSLLNAQPGSFQTHQRVLERLRTVIAPENWSATRLQYIAWDLLNLVFGNSDNHCRNIALLKTDDTVKLAPVFDFAPMKMDLEGVTRTTTWEGFELGGVVDWPGLLESFGDDEEELRAGLRPLALRLRKLPQLLGDLGLPAETLRFPALDFRGTEKRLRAWSLL